MNEDIFRAARHVLHVWENEDTYEKQDLSDEFFEAMSELRRAVMVIREVVPR